MNIWIWVIAASLTVYWSTFFYLLTRRRWDAPALTVGVLHMLFASMFVAAPIRSFLDPSYLGFGVGLVRFEGRWATLPSTVFLSWALAAAWIAVSLGKGQWMKLITVGDILFALNLGGGFLLDYMRGDLGSSKIQGGEFFTLQGTVAALIPLLLFALPFVASALWATRRIQSGGTTPPLAQGTMKKDKGLEEDTRDINGFRYSDNRI
jgi:hypothetical protein